MFKNKHDTSCPLQPYKISYSKNNSTEARAVKMQRGTLSALQTFVTAHHQELLNLLPQTLDQLFSNMIRENSNENYFLFQKSEHL